MKRLSFTSSFFAIVLTMSGCHTANPNHTYDATVLDDKVTSQRVQAALKRAGPAFNNVHVSTNNGTILLAGSVKSPQDHERAEEIARSVHRVTGLEDDLKISQ